MIELNHYVLLLIGSLGGILLFFSFLDALRIFFPKTEKYSKSEDKMLVLKAKENLQIKGGELEPEFYHKFVEKIEEPGNKKIELDFICTPPILIEKKYREEVRNNTGEIKNLDKYHPLFNFAKNNPERIRIYLCKQKRGDEYHYAIGTTPRIICVEEPHKAGDPKKGVFYYNDKSLWRALRSKIENEKKISPVWKSEDSVDYILCKD